MGGTLQQLGTFAAQAFAFGLYRSSGRQLFLEDAGNGGEPLLLRMTQDSLAEVGWQTEGMVWQQQQ